MEQSNGNTQQTCGTRKRQIVCFKPLRFGGGLSLHGNLAYIDSNVKHVEGGRLTRWKETCTLITSWMRTNTSSFTSQ